MKENKSIKNVNKKKGISLIVLVITIIVIVILAVAVILSIADNNPISNANKASFQNDVKSMQEELELIKASNYAESQGKDYGTISFDSLTGKDKYKEKFDIKNGELVYTSKLKGDELTWAKELGIASSAFVLDESTESGITITEVDGKQIFRTNWYDRESNITTVPFKLEEIVEIPDGVVKIGDAAFYNGDNDVIKITTVILPDTVKEIGNQAFWYCNKLKEINLPYGLEHIGNAAFKDCGLKNIVLPDTIKTIDDAAFGGCNLKEFIIPDNIESIGDMVFWGCSNLTVKISEETAKRLWPDITSEVDVANKLEVDSVVFK